MAIGDSTRVNTNIAAFNALNSLKTVNRNLEISQLRLATGRRINEVADDPAGFVISRTRCLATAQNHTGTAKNVLSIAEGGLLNISDILVTMKEKVTQAASDTMGTAERDAIKSEINQLTSEIDDIVAETLFNGIALIDGSYTGKSYQTGEATTDTTSFGLSQGHTATGLSVEAANVANKLTDATNAASALDSVNGAIDTISTSLQNIGAMIARLTVKESTLSVALTNSEATKSRILDADIASEQLESTRLQILQQTATAQLAQANVTPQNVLALFT